jgi:N-methylhydantoinase B
VRGRAHDPVTLALDRSLFAACAEEMGITLMRTAHSPNITERLDHSCAIFDGEGRLVSQAAHIPVHLGSLPRAVEAAIAHGPLAPGDVVLLNDPFAGGTHLPDLTLVSPVYLTPRARVVRQPEFLVASRAHHADVGGAAPGSMPIAREVYEEGLRLPPILLVREGELVEDVLAIVLANVRTPDERRADLAAQLGAQATGERRLRELAERARNRGGARALVRSAAALLDAAESEVRAAIATLPRGSWRFTDALDDDGVSEGPVPIMVTLTISAHRIRLDFTGSSPQRPGPVNAVEAVTHAACGYALRCVLGELPINHGTFRPFDIVAPLGTVVNPRPPAAVSAGNVETSQRIVDVVLGVVVRERVGTVPAASYGTMSNLLVGGVDPRTGRPFAYYETLGGGHGAGPGWNGASAMQAHMTNTRNTPIESLEHAYPLRVRETSIRRGSGGAGRFTGGAGIVRAIEMLAPVRVSVISDRRTRGPYGLSGGGDGARGANRVQQHATGGSPRTMPGKFQIDLGRGAVLTVASPGGGGYGRAPRALVRARSRSRARSRTRAPS